MIHESAPWKAELLKDADMIERWAQKQSASERRSFLIEKKVFISAYAMRRLFEGEKLTSGLNSLSIAAKEFVPLPGRELTWWKTHSFEKVFDLSTPVRHSVGASDLLNVIIHSKLFAECIYDMNDLRCIGFFVTSEKRNDHLWLVPISSYTKLIREVGSDYPSSARIVFDAETGKHFSWRGHGEPPTDVARKMNRIVGDSNKVE